MFEAVLPAGVELDLKERKEKYEAVHRFESQSFCMEFECLAPCVGEGEGGILMSSRNSKIMQVGDDYSA